MSQYGLELTNLDTLLLKTLKPLSLLYFYVFSVYLRPGILLTPQHKHTTLPSHTN